MNTSRILLLNLLIITPLCYAAETDIHELNRQLVQLAGKHPERIEDYRCFIDYSRERHHHVSNLTIHQLVDDWTTEYQVVDNNNAKVICSMKKGNEAFRLVPWQALWYDEAGEHIALRHPEMVPLQQVFRVSFLSALKRTDRARQDFLQDAVEHHRKHGTGYPIDYNYTDYRLYIGLPRELRISRLFDLSFEAQISEFIDNSYATIAAIKRALSCYDGVLERIP